MENVGRMTDSVNTAATISLDSAVIDVKMVSSPRFQHFLFSEEMVFRLQNVDSAVCIIQE